MGIKSCFTNLSLLLPFLGVNVVLRGWFMYNEVKFEVMKTRVTWRRWQHSISPRCERLWMFMPRSRLKLWKWSRLCLGATMKSRVSNVKEGRTTMPAAQRWPYKNATYREIYILVCNWYRSAIEETKTEHYSGKNQEYSGDHRKLFKIIKFLIKPLQQEQDPDFESTTIPRVPVKYGDMFVMPRFSSSHINTLLNKSLQIGYFPDEWKMLWRILSWKS